MLVTAGRNAGAPRESAAETRIVATGQNRQREVSKGMEEVETPSLVWMMCAGE